MRFYAGAPLRTRDGFRLGTLCILDREPREFEPAQVARLEDMAMIVMDELELRLSATRALEVEHERRLESEGLAETLRRSLLPRRLPAIPGAQLAAILRPASQAEVGGDFYDCFELGSKRWGLVIGDVTGKGPEAAAVTAMVRHSTRTAAIDGKDPAEILATANRVLLLAGDENDHRFATMIFVEIRQTDRSFSVRLACAGHPPMLLARRSQIIEALTTAGPGIGMFDGAEFEARTIELELGDTLFLHTDGLTDARSEGGFMNPQNAVSLMSDHPDASATEIVEAVRVFAAREGALDDVAAIVFKVWG